MQHCKICGFDTPNKEEMLNHFEKYHIKEYQRATTDVELRKQQIRNSSDEEIQQAIDTLVNEGKIFPVIGTDGVTRYYINSDYRVDEKS